MPNFESLGNVKPNEKGNGYGHALLACMHHRVLNNTDRGGGDTMNQARMVGAHSAFVSYSPHRSPFACSGTVCVCKGVCVNPERRNPDTPEKTRGYQEWTSTHDRVKKMVAVTGVNLTMVCEVAMKTSKNRFEGNAKSVNGAGVTWF